MADSLLTKLSSIKLEKSSILKSQRQLLSKKKLIFICINRLEGLQWIFQLPHKPLKTSEKHLEPCTRLLMAFNKEQKRLSKTIRSESSTKLQRKSCQSGLNRWLTSRTISQFRRQNSSSTMRAKVRELAQ